MEWGGVAESLLFVLAISALVTFPFVLIIGGVMVMKWAMTRHGPSRPPDDASSEL
jgi:hypothetical protein